MSLIASGSAQGQKTTKRKEIVMDEDEYVNTVKEIIVRDYFPDLPKLQSNLEMLEAVNSGDPLKIREAQLRHAALRRRIARESSIGGTPNTPGISGSMPNLYSLLPSPSIGRSDGIDSIDDVGDSVSVIAEQSANQSPASLSLNQFAAGFTSEDNASFLEIADKEEQNRKEKAWWMYDDVKNKELPNHGKQQMLAITSGSSSRDSQLMPPPPPRSIPPSSSSSSSSSSRDLQFWDHHARNALMFVPEGVPFQKKISITSSSSSLPQERPSNKQINKRGTRIHLDPSLASSASSSSVIASDSSSPAFPVTSNSPQLFGYSFVSTPQIEPGVAASPLMTFGEIMGTPLRLDPLDQPLDLDSKFRLPEQTKREEVAEKMLQEQLVRKRSKKGMSSFSTGSVASSALPSSSSSSASAIAPSRLTAMSPAARKMAETLLKQNRVGTDSQLRASYGSATPDRSSALSSVGSVRNTPRRPSSVVSSVSVLGNGDRRKASSISSSSTKAEESKSKSSITDGLLML